MSIKKQFLKTKPVVKVTFEVSAKAAQGAESVFLICEALNWEKIQLKKLKTGNFKGVADLPTNQKEDFEYKFCLVMPDGSEIYDNDWEAELYRSNGVDGDNSVVLVTA